MWLSTLATALSSCFADNLSSFKALRAFGLSLGRGITESATSNQVKSTLCIVCDEVQLFLILGFCLLAQDGFGVGVGDHGCHGQFIACGGCGREQGAQSLQCTNR